MKISKEKQQHLAVVAGVTLAILAALYWFGISNPKSEMAKLKKDIDAKEDEVTAAKRVILTKDAVQTELTSSTNELSEIESGMAPANDKYGWFLNMLSQFSKPYTGQVNIRDKSKETIADVLTYETFPYKSAIFTVKGDAFYHQLGRFIADLENSHPFFRVQRLTLSPAPSDAELNDKISFEFDIVTLVNTNSL